MSIITLDKETYYSKEYSLSKMTTEEYIRDPRFQLIGFSYQIDDGKPTWITGSDKYMAEHLHSLELEKHTLIAQNSLFDASIMSWHYGIHPKFIIDTMSMAAPIQSITKGKSLDALARHFKLGVKGKEVVAAMGKRREDFTPEELARYGGYCDNDVALTYALFNTLREYSTPQEMYVIDMFLRLYTDPILVLNKPLLEQHLVNVVERKEALLAKVEAIVGKDGLMSNPKFAAVLQKLGVVPPTKISKSTGKETFAFAKTDAPMKELLAHPDDRVQAVVAARMGVKSTLEETRTRNFIAMAVRGTLPIALNYYGAHTGRASGAESMNLQNLPRGGTLRQAIEAPPGYKVIACDSSQIEARVVAWLAGQEDLLEAFRNKVDIYSSFASDVYGYEVNKSMTDQRFVGKTAILGLGFQMGWKRFAEQVKSMSGIVISEADAKRVVNLYRSKYYRISELWDAADTAMKIVVAGGTAEFGVGIKLIWASEGVHLPNGMIVRYPGLRYDAEYESFVYDDRYGKRNRIYAGKIIENVVQALARIIVFYQTCKIDKQLRKYDKPQSRFKIVLSVHDEAVTVAPAKAAEKVKEMMVKTMSQPPVWAPDLPVACEAEIGANYGECK
ncbi:DNA polymerase [Undibacterium sp. Ji42W]|uniref:DNA polymerase n=1 Tax=Undibacterium sp. Ji42W TaxID=3413039 RepID=UPI003BEF913A